MKSELIQEMQPKKLSVGKVIGDILKDVAEFKGWQLIFQVMLYGFVAWGVYALYIVYLFHHVPEFAHVSKFSLTDFKLSVIPTIIFFFYKRACLKFLSPWIYSRLDPTKFETEEDKKERSLKASIWLGNVIYYSFTSVLVVYLFHDTFFFPPLMGGSGSCKSLYAHAPFVPFIPNAVFFYQMQFGWHFHTLLDHIAYKRKDPKFWEMFLHHSVAVFLIFFSYLSNQIAVGILVLATHDPSDIGLCGSRIYNDFKGKKFPLLVFIYAAFVLSWIYLRLFVFPKCVVGEAVIAYKNYAEDMMAPVYMYMIVMMTALVILHLYWFVFIFRIVWNLIAGGKKDYNSYDKIKVEKKN